MFQKIFERDEKSATASENDVNYLVKTIQQEGVLERDEASLVNNALKFDDTPISSVMIRRFAYLNTTDTAQQIRNKFIKTNYSRMPVLNSKGNPIGFVLSKDILRDFVQDYDSIQSFNLEKYIKTLHTITCNDNLDDALRIMQRTNTHMLGITNSKKHRKLSGIVTMEIVIEQLVGKIYDEKDKVDDIQAINSFT
ncbi:MAG: CBS domain-containing protein [Mycoplasmoidaceae bacterium]|nr:CBS domain-containing protein [Mycoplasmoidaceae bacterium]